MAFFCSFDTESIVNTLEFSMYSISIPYTFSSSFIGIYIVSSFSITLAYVLLLDPFILILFSSILIAAIFVSYVVII